MKARVLALFGPTAVGKTEVAIAIATSPARRAASTRSPSPPTRCRSTRGLETLTGVATAEQQRELEHRLVSFLPVDARFSVAEYAALAHAQIDELLAAGATPIVVGGTGLYLRAALTELSLRPPPPPGARERWNAELERRGPQALHALLAQRAPWAAREIHPVRPPPDRARPRARGDRRARAAAGALASSGASTRATRRAWSAS